MCFKKKLEDMVYITKTFFLSFFFFFFVCLFLFFWWSLSPFFFSVPDKGIRCQNVELFDICAPSSFDEYSFLVLLCFLFVCLCVCVHVYVHACACVRVRFCMSL